MGSNAPSWENSSPPAEVSIFLSPTGLINDTASGYEWNSIVDNTWYHLWVNDASDNVINRWYTESALNCESGGACSVISSETLAEGNVDWYMADGRVSGMHGFRSLRGIACDLACTWHRYMEGKNLECIGVWVLELCAVFFVE